MFRNLSSQRVLSLLQGSGVKVDHDGHISDWQDKPPRNARPLADALPGEYGHRAHRAAFAEHEDDIVKLWWHAAQREGISGSQIFEELETVLPGHSRQAYDNRWRKILQNHELPMLAFDKPFPGLVRSGMHRPGFANQTADLEHDPSGTETSQNHMPRRAQGQADNDSQDEDQNRGEHYSDHRIESNVKLFAKLGIDHESQLRDLLRCSWLLNLYKELHEAGQVSGWLQKQPLDKGISGLEAVRLPISKSTHTWKLNQAITILELPDFINSRYRSAEQNKSYFSEDDYDLRFIVRASFCACARGQIWESENQNENGWRGPATKALWLLIWLKWVHKKTEHEKREAQRQQQKRTRWLKFLETQLQRITQIQERDSSNSAQRERRLDVDRQRFLISDQARSLYINRRDQRLASWGLSSSYSGTCVLLPAKWAYTKPAALAEDPSSWLLDELKEPRLLFSLGSFCFTWGRATVWFETWPRDLLELQRFLSLESDRKMASYFHGSHLCHHSLCILPAHLCYESGMLNYSRMACAVTAKRFRLYGTPIPQHCVEHNPPCLLQLAALTTFEALAIQFNVLRLARDLPAAAPVSRPENHPARYRTFEHGPILSDDFPSVRVQSDRLIRLTTEQGFMDTRGFERTCIFCTSRLAFSSMTNFWAHLRFIHADGDRNAVIDEVRTSSEAYLAWADEHFYNCKTVNPNTWQKCVQARAPDFDWEVFSTWRLNKEKLLTGKTV